MGKSKPKNHSQQESSKFKDAFPNQDFWSRSSGTNATPGGVKPTDFNLSEKMSAIFEMLHLLDEKITKVNNRFSKLAKELGYKA